MSRLLLMALTLPFTAAPVDANVQEETRLDEVLREWAKASDAVKESHFKIQVTRREETTDETSASSLEVFVRKRDLMRIEYKEQKGKRGWFVYKERIVRWLTSDDKLDRYYPLSDGFGFPEHSERYPDEFFSRIGGRILELESWLAFGLPVRDLKSRFKLRLSNEDDNCFYIEMEPRKKTDLVEFTRLRVVLDRKTHLVQQLWMEQPNAATTTYDYERPKEDAAESITPESILKGLPENYKKVTLPLKMP